ncbi:NB-ARC domain-containing protein [Funiculus sociatus GB2-M2]|uniref:NB-ARC domain-containing protein n=1 Tax=Cyanophyceae TaxID=3028117 RepID=UPI0018EF5C45|nr:NB-ARC domain-containing protein [Trichocoleus sp. FACHB-90]
MTEQEAIALVDTLLCSAHLGQKLNDVQSVVFIETWTGRSYAEIAKQLGYQNDYIKQVGSQLWRSLSQLFGEPVSKRNIQAVLRRYQQSQQGKQDWGEAIDVSRFYNRHEERRSLESWILEDCCRWIGIFGLGGMGKTALSVKIAQQVRSRSVCEAESQFEFVIWRSLQQAPPLNALIREILPILTRETETPDASINSFMAQLRVKRCLLVLDNVESILQGKERSGQYQSGYQDYRCLFERIADEPHQSCLVITGREKPGGFTVREGKNLPVRSLLLKGLAAADGEEILIDKGVNATELQRQAIVNYLGGNPLALKIAATTIQELFSGDAQAFLAQGSTVFSDLWDLLEQQFERLSPLQQKIMYCLAIHPEGVTPAKLQAEILSKVSGRELLEVLESLKERSLVDVINGNLKQQPVILEYVTQRLIQTIKQEVTTTNVNLFRSNTLIKAQTQYLLA